MLTVGALMSTILWYLAHKAVRGRSPFGDATAKLNQIPVTGPARQQPWAQSLAKGGGTLYLNMQYANPDIGRGLRATGLQGYFDVRNKGGSRQQAAESALVDLLNSWTTPLTGPAVRAMIAGGAGIEPHIQSMLDVRGGNAPACMSSLPRHNVPFTILGQKETGLPANALWRTRAAVMQLNQMFGVGLENIGVIQRNPDDKDANAVRSAVDVILPSLVTGPYNPQASQAYIQRQRAAMGK